MSTPLAAVFCTAGHRFADFTLSEKDGVGDHPTCLCGRPQVGYTFHYDGDVNECRGDKAPLQLLGTATYRRWWRDSQRRRHWKEYTFQLYDVTQLVAS